MKKRVFALLCVLAFMMPALCASEKTGTSYTCDGCDYEGSFNVTVTGTETRDGAPGEWIALQCPSCGRTLLNSWRQTGPAATPEPAPTPVPAPPPPPVTAAPPAPAPPPVTAAPKITQAPARETKPPVVPDSAAQAAPEPAPVPAARSEGGGPSGTGSSGTPARQNRRNLQKYPYFSTAFPSRRLNLEGEAEALAPVPGIRIYPAAGSSILQHMLDGGEPGK